MPIFFSFCIFLYSCVEHKEINSPADLRKEPWNQSNYQHDPVRNLCSPVKIFFSIFWPNKDLLRHVWPNERWTLHWLRVTKLSHFHLYFILFQEALEGLNLYLMKKKKIQFYRRKWMSVCLLIHQIVSQLFPLSSSKINLK